MSHKSYRMRYDRLESIIKQQFAGQLQVWHIQLKGLKKKREIKFVENFIFDRGK